MATDNETLCEMALGHLGIADDITTLATDQTAIAKAFRRYFTPTLTEVLEAHPWSFATRYFDVLGQVGLGTVTVAANVGTFTLGQDLYLDPADTVTIGTVDYVVGARTSTTVWALTGANVTAQAFTIVKGKTQDPTDDWGWSYRVPDVALVVRRLVDGNRTPIRSNWPVHRMGTDASGRLLYTDEDVTVVIEHTALMSDPTTFTALFDHALSCYLAFKVAPLLTRGDPNKLGNRAYQMYQMALGDAQARDANENRQDDEPDAELIQVR